MNIVRYVSDQKWLLSFYAVLMSFITAVVYADPQGRITLNSLVYLHSVGLFFLLLYLSTTYGRQKNYIQAVSCILQDVDADLPCQLPMPQTSEQQSFHDLILLVHQQRLADIAKLQAEKKELIEYTISWCHDIKMPIAVSRLLLENRSENVNQLLDGLEEELDRVEFQVEQALYFARANDFFKDYLIQEINLERVVKTSIKTNAKAFIHKHIGIELNCAPVTVLSDSKWLTFILNQLLANTLQYTPPGGKVRITTAQDGHTKSLKIWDNGTGIPPEDLQRVFEKGFTGHNGRQYQHATGLGLYLVKKLAKKLGHDITITSAWNRYTEVTIIFPKLLDYYRQDHNSLK